jgi:hypothetical protein
MEALINLEQSDRRNRNRQRRGGGRLPRCAWRGRRWLPRGAWRRCGWLPHAPWRGRGFGARRAAPSCSPLPGLGRRGVFRFGFRPHFTTVPIRQGVAAYPGAYQRSGDASRRVFVRKVMAATCIPRPGTASAQPGRNIAGRPMASKRQGALNCRNMVHTLSTGWTQASQASTRLVSIHRPIARVAG